MTCTLAFSDLDTNEAEAAPEPAPTGTMITSVSGRSSMISNVQVPTPATSSRSVGPMDRALSVAA